jgi:hypothetical protein
MTENLPSSCGRGKRWYRKGMACCQVAAQGPGASSISGGKMLALCQRQGCVVMLC